MHTTTIDRWIERHAGFQPNAIAIHFEEQNISYASLWQDVQQCAVALSRHCGIGQGDRVAWLGQNHPSMLSAMFACAHLGAMLVPINWRLSDAEIHYILEDCGAKLVLVDAPMRETAQVIQSSSNIVQWLSVEPETHFSTLQSLYSTPIEQRIQPSEPTLQDPLLNVYTSGTTGHPKGAVLTQEALLFNALNSQHMHDMTRHDTCLTVLPMFHVGGLNNQTTPMLYCGGAVILHRKFDPGATLEALTRQQPQLTVQVPATINALTAHPDWATADFTSLRAVTTGSSIVPQSVLDAFESRRIPVIQVYGCTETCPIAVYQLTNNERLIAGSTGRPALHTQIKLVDTQGRTVAAGNSGEVCVKGPNVLQGYWGLPEATAETLRDGWFHTGDVGSLDEQGCLHIIERVKDLIISGGENVYPAEIERVLHSQPGIVDAAVVGRSDSEWGEVPVAFVVAQEPAPAPEDIQRHLKKELARFKHPREIRFVDDLPRTSLGKIKKFTLRQQLENEK